MTHIAISLGPTVWAEEVAESHYSSATERTETA